MQLGKYRHFKGNLYEVVGIAKHSETLEDMVVYTHYDAVKGEKEMSLRVRPQAMFEEDVDPTTGEASTQDGRVKRFTHIE